MSDRRDPRSPRRAWLWLVPALAFIVTAVPGHAQTAPEGPLALQGELDLSNPGARSLGMGGAFIARADDSTAAYVNPAGLIHLRHPEVALEIRRIDGEIEVFGPAGERSTLDNTSTGASFASVSYPLERLTLALYRQELVDLDVSAPPGSQRAGAARAGDLEIGVTGIGLAAAFEVVQWLRVGVAIVDYSPDIVGRVTDPSGATTTVRGDDSELGYTLGYQADLGESWSVGFFFRDLPSFDLDIEPAAGEPGAAKRAAEYTLPDSFGLGVAWQATHRLIASFDYAVIQYSTTVDDTEYEGGTFVAPDAHQARLGFEYTLWEYASSPAFRAGVWRDPDHRVHWQPGRGAPSLRPRAEFPRGDDEIHVSVGAGVVLGRFQVDAAADFSDSVDTYSVSVVFFP